MRYIQRSKLLLILCLSFAFFIEFPKEGYSTTYAIHADRAALNQEIYNYVDVLNEPIDSMYYYVNGSLVASSGPINNKRFLFSHVFSYVGNQSFYVQIVLPGGTTREYSWITNIYVPTKNLFGAINYAEQYAINPNTAYRDFSLLGGGGDCTNFISQILHEGGGFPEERGNAVWYKNWFYDGYFTYSNTWTVVDNFYTYMRDYKGIVDNYSGVSLGIYIGSNETYSYPPLLQGSIIRYGFPNGLVTNAFVITRGADSVNQGKFDGLQPLVDYHTPNRQHINWTLVTVNPFWYNTSLINNRIKWDY